MSGPVHPELLPWYVADNVSRQQAQEIETHLEGCESCRAELLNLESMRATLREEASRDYSGIETADSAHRVSGAPRMVRQVAGVAAVLLVSAVAGFVGFRLGSAQSSLGLRVIETEVLRHTTRGTDETASLRGTGPWALTVVLPSNTTAEFFDLWVETAKGTRVDTLGTTVATDLDQTVSVLVEELPPGEYTLVLRESLVENASTHRYSIRIDPGE